MAKVATAGAKPLTKSEIAAHIAERAQISKKQARDVLEAQAKLAYKQAKNTFTIPGIGKLKLREVPARDVTLRFPPERAGEVVHKPRSKKVKFSVAKACRDAILGAKK